MTRMSRLLPPASWLAGALAALVVVLLSPATQAQVPQRGYSAGYVPNDELTPLRDWSEDIPAHIAVVDGDAWHDRDGEVLPADENVPLLAGDRIRTQRGRLEVLFADGSSLDLDEGTDVELLSELLVRLNAGLIRLTLVRSSGPVDYRIDSGGASVWIRAAGEYRISARGPGAEVRLTVLRGLAELSSPFGRSVVQGGTEAVTTDRSTPSMPYAVNASASDPFERWVQARASERTGDRYEASAQYLPEDIRYYSGTLSRYGAWENHPSDGYVWYPRVVADWRPYYDGHWSFVGSFGWFWVGGTSWSWPTHHYGRWGTHYGRWYWIPERRWGPAWVSWASAPGYVSWCPLGSDNRPIYSIAGTWQNAWRGWTVLPSRSFATNVYVRRAAVNARATLPRDVRFVERDQAPVRPASFRSNQAPLRSPSSYELTRSAQSRDGRVPVDRQETTGLRATPGATPSNDTVTTRRAREVADSQRADRPAMERPTGGSPTRMLRAPSTNLVERTTDNQSRPVAQARTRTTNERPDFGRTDDESSRSGATAPIATRRAPSAGNRGGETGVSDPPRSSAPERAVENRTSPRPSRMEPRSAAPERTSQSERSRVERSSPAERPAPPRGGPTERGSGSATEVGSRGGTGSSAPDAGASTGRQAPSGAPSAGSARARSR